MAEDFQKMDEKDDLYAINRDIVEDVLKAVEADSQSDLLAIFQDLHEADIADILEQITPEDRRRVMRLWGEHVDGEVLTELEEGVRDDIMEDTPDEILAEAVKDLDTDDVVYLVEDLEPPQQEKLLESLDDADRIAVEQSLSHEEDTAGRLMQREMVVAPQHWTVGDAIDYMRSATDLPQDFYDVIVVNPAMHPVGTVPLGKLMGAAREVFLSELMNPDFHAIPVDTPDEDVAYIFNQYHMVSAPVVDHNGRLVGVITIDDAMEILEDEAEEDMKRLAGVGDEELSSSVRETAKLRFPWLAVNLVSSITAAFVISRFSDAINSMVALAVLMPIVASMGGNAGTQTLTVTVRALATRDLTSANALRIIGREMAVGLVNGLAFAVLVGGIGYFWFGNPMLGVVLGLAMIGNMFVAALAGILVPMGLEKLGADPALASGAFVTTMTDIVGFFTFLGLATLILL